MDVRVECAIGRDGPHARDLLPLPCGSQAKVAGMLGDRMALGLAED
jgi:hypothetical protein